MEFYERVSGARMHAAFYRPGTVFIKFLSQHLLTDISFFCSSCAITINEIHFLLATNKIWKLRLVGVGPVSPNMVSKYALSGVMARGSGVAVDVRAHASSTYSNYFYLDFASYLGINGDSYDRYLLRICEIFESLQIVNTMVLKIQRSRQRWTQAL